MRNLLSSLALALCLAAPVSAQQFIPLWPDGKIPNATQIKVEELVANERVQSVMIPGMFEYMPNAELFNGTAVVICPGGAYSILSRQKEGLDVAKAYNLMGVAAYVLNYRLPHTANVDVSYKAPLQDALRAVRKVRERALSWPKSSGKVGIIGFSAGGHLATTAGTLFRQDWPNIGDALDTLSCRPDFMILVYPVISMQQGLTHQGSRDNLLGKTPSQELIDLFSNEKQVTPQTPPTLLIHASDDMTVSVANSLRFYEALIANRVRAAMHIFTRGGHGFGPTNRGEIASWVELSREWLMRNELITDPNNPNPPVVRPQMPARPGVSATISASAPAPAR